MTDELDNGASEEEKQYFRDYDAGFTARVDGKPFDEEWSDASKEGWIEADLNEGIEGAESATQ